jgi:hypothetical protein
MFGTSKHMARDVNGSSQLRFFCWSASAWPKQASPSAPNGCNQGRAYGRVLLSRDYKRESQRSVLTATNARKHSQSKTIFALPTL